MFLTFRGKGENLCELSSSQKGKTKLFIKKNSQKRPLEDRTCCSWGEGPWGRQTTATLAKQTLGQKNMFGSLSGAAQPAEKLSTLRAVSGLFDWIAQSTERCLLLSMQFLFF